MCCVSLGKGHIVLCWIKTLSSVTHTRFKNCECICILFVYWLNLLIIYLHFICKLLFFLLLSPLIKLLFLLSFFLVFLCTVRFLFNRDVTFDADAKNLAQLLCSCLFCIMKAYRSHRSTLLQNNSLFLVLSAFCF